MKKLRLIVTSVIVLAIVGGAFAFKAKCCNFCVITGTTAGNCTTFKVGFMITTDALATPYRYYPAWDGTRTQCTKDANASCTAQIRLIIN